MARNYTGNIVEEQSYLNWYDFVNHCESATPNSTRRESRVDGDREWNGTKTWEKALTLARKGWPELGVKVKLLSDDLFAKLSRYCMRPEPHYKTEGNILDVGRWLDGEPEHWLVMDESETTSQGKRVCRIVYNQTASAGVSTEVMQAKGATIAALVRLLDYADIRSEIELIGVIAKGYGNDNNSDRIAYRVNVKDAAQDLDFDIVSFALGHPASFRRMGFACMETFSAETCKWHANYNYGYPSDLNASERSACDVYVGSQMLGEPQWTDTRACQKWVLSQLQSLGVTLSEEAGKV